MPPTERLSERPSAPWSGASWLVLFSVFVTGAVVMVVEILGTRVLGPFFGVGLFAWCAQLAVTLAALACGYLVGGKVAQGDRPERALRNLVFVAGIWIALVPVLAPPILTFGDGFGLRAGTLISAVLLYGPCLLAMGAVTPLGVELLSRTDERPGSAAGRVYAMSTVGGLISTVATGFYLIPHFSLDTIWAAVASVLLLLGAYWASGAWRKRVLPLAAFVPWFLAQAPNDQPVDGVCILTRSESLYGKLAVVEDTRRSTALRLLRAEHSFIGAHWQESKQPAFGFVHLLEAVVYARPQATRALQIGLGIGSFSELVRERGLITDVVEIDPDVVRLAKEYFDYQPTGKVTVEDARTFVSKTMERYDIVVHDSFTGGATPEHLVTVEVFEDIQSILEPNGVLVLNFVGAISGELKLPALALRRTLGHVFEHVDVFREQPVNEDPEGISNIVFFASQRPVRFEIPEPLKAADSSRSKILTEFQNWRVLTEVDPSAALIDDASNPLALLTLPLAERFRATMRELYPREFWLN